MPSQARSLISLFRTIVPAGFTALLIASAALPMSAQSPVPPTAVQAARMPQFASRLAHPTPQPASRPNRVLARQSSRSGPPQGNDIYDNGLINGNTDAWAINYGFIVSDTFTITYDQTQVSGMSFGAWLFVGDTLTTAELSITSSENGGTSYFDQTVNFTQSGCILNQLGYNVCTVSTTFSGPMLNTGTYWVNLQNASVPSGDPVYWDENSGVGCTGSGCPSQGSENDVGTIPSETFTIEGSSCYENCQPPPQCFQSQGNLQIIYNGGGNGVTIDRAGNLYGTSPYGGGLNAGFAYKLAHFAGGWLVDPLFDFFGGNSGGEPFGVIVGPNGSLYGGAQGGIQNCGTGGSQYCGLVYNLKPKPTACVTALCSWNENVPYRFSSEIDGSGTINVSAFDREGNLYGTTSSGGTFNAGTVFELTPSGGGWTKTTLYNFIGGNNGNPTEVLVGTDGNLYGVANGNFGSNGVVFQLTPSGGQWVESVLVAFNGSNGSEPSYLVQDNAGSLYGIVGLVPYGGIFTLQKTSSGRYFSEYAIPYDGCCYDGLNNLVIDAAGNLYGTGGGAGMDDENPFGHIFKASYDSDGWHYEDLVYLTNTEFPASGSLALDTSGNLYGTTSSCGTNGSGTVWQLSP
ncbi:MAG: choice-of-anchor tandem repeat GloVer-containing protein [Candidatus Korobacteraceae bacterium]